MTVIHITEERLLELLDMKADELFAAIEEIKADPIQRNWKYDVETHDPDMISRAEDDLQTQKAVAAERQAVVEECLALIPVLKDQEAWVAHLFDRIRTSIIALAPDGVRTDTDMISRAEADRQTQEAVTAALMEAARRIDVECWTDFEEGQNESIVLAEQGTTKPAIREVLDLLPPDAVRLLEERDARVRKEALMDAAIYFGADEETAEEMIAAIREGEA